MGGLDKRLQAAYREAVVAHLEPPNISVSVISPPGEAIEHARRSIPKGTLERLFDLLTSLNSSVENLESNSSLLDQAKQLLKSSDKQERLLGIDLLGAFGTTKDRKELLQLLKDPNSDDQTKIRVIGALSYEPSDAFESNLVQLYKANSENEDINQYLLAASDTRFRDGVATQLGTYRLGWILYNYFKNDYASVPASSYNPSLIDAKKFDHIAKLSGAKNELVQKGYYLSLAFAQNDNADKILIENLNTGDDSKKELVVSAIIMAERLDMLPKVKEAATSGKIPFEHALRAIVKLQDDTSGEYLKKHLEEALNNGSPKTQSAILQMYRNYSEILPPIDPDIIAKVKNSDSPMVQLEFAKTYPKYPGSLASLKIALEKQFAMSTPTIDDQIQKIRLAILIGSGSSLATEADRVFMGEHITKIISSLQKANVSYIPKDLAQQFIDLTAAIDNPVTKNMMIQLARLQEANLSDAAMLKLAASGGQGLKEIANEMGIERERAEKALEYLQASPFKSARIEGRDLTFNNAPSDDLRRSVMTEAVGMILSDVRLLDPDLKDQFIDQIIREKNPDKIIQALGAFGNDRSSKIRLIAAFAHHDPTIVNRAADFGITLSDITQYLISLSAEEKGRPSFQLTNLYIRLLNETNSDRLNRSLALLNLIQELGKLPVHENPGVHTAFVKELSKYDNQLLSQLLIGNLVSNSASERVYSFIMLKCLYQVENPNSAARSPLGFHQFLETKLHEFVDNPAALGWQQQKAEDLLKMSDKLKEFDIFTQWHLDGDLMAAAIKGREYLANQSGSSSDSGLDESREALVVFVARADWNGGISNALNVMLNGIAQKKNVFLFEVASPSDVIKYSNQLRDKNIKADRIYISGHGTPTTLDFSNDDEAIGLYPSGDRSKVLHVTDFPSLIKGAVGSVLKPGGMVDFDGCSNGRGLKQANNIGNWSRNLFPHARLYGNRSLGADGAAYDIIGGRIRSVGAGGWLVPAFPND